MAGLIFFIFFDLSEAKIRDPFNLNKSKFNAKPELLILPLHYISPTNMRDLLKNSRQLLSNKATISVDERTNQLWIFDVPQRLIRLKTLIRKLDIPVQQVLIQARLVSIDKHSLNLLGAMVQIPPVSTVSRIESQDDTLLPTVTFKNKHKLDLTLIALQQAGHANIISSPELMTNNRQTASIESGEEIPYQEKTGEGNTSAVFKKATLRLQVTPNILPGNHILLKLNVNQDKVGAFTVNGVPAIRTQGLKTTVVVHDHETLILGGIYEQSEQQTSKSIPFFSKVPLIGRLFGHHEAWHGQKQLFIFVTPQIIK